ncbi:hypothetical protein [Formosa algae]|uniref:Chromosome segregation ATPase n=1 Tax=Formosa algae TaxID=225843 RepID=A0A9X0YKJ4_9FLAO|nr:hypothetical protein [Formosa algae]MBP1840795.1 chromosome segregation ATPase [Formosa algae]MDQ0336308.1 chromosome segregation ATPase [Formosa algae]OEI80335.1 hypothetical protein AST99_09965 [Formosa algae]
MSNIEEIVDALEDKISKMLRNVDALKQENAKLKEDLQNSQHNLQNHKLEIEAWSEKYEALKIAKSMLGSDDNKKETKLKINSLVREIDYCISQLSE